MRPILIAAAIVIACGPAWAADLSIPAGEQVILTPTVPLGLASEFPKSPLTEAFVERHARFSDEHEAQASCPADTVVWVQKGSKVYQLIRRARQAGSGFGAYMCQAAALSEGDHPTAVP